MRRKNVISFNEILKFELFSLRICIQPTDLVNFPKKFSPVKKKTQKIAKYDEINENLAILTRKNKRNSMKFSGNIEFVL